MREWLKANGGPTGLVIVGIGLVFAFWPVGAVFVAIGTLMSLNAAEWCPTVHLGRRDGVQGVWVEPPTRALGAKRNLRRRTSTLIHDLHRSESRAYLIHPDEQKAANAAAKEGTETGEDWDAAWDKRAAPLLKELVDGRRARERCEFRQRVGEVAEDYVRRGMLSDHQAEVLEDEFCDEDQRSVHSMEQEVLAGPAVIRLERLLHDL